MRNILAIVGAAVVALGLLGSLGVGHFRLVYSPDPITCGRSA